MKLKSKRLIVRRLDKSDLKDFHAYRSVPEVVKYQGFGPFTLEEAEAFIDEYGHETFGKPGNWVQYGIEEKDTGRLIGDCAVRLLEEDIRIGEIGITLSPEAHGKGYASETVDTLLTWMFDELKLHRVVETVDAENLAAIRLLERMGFRKEGHFIENIFFKGKWGSEMQYAMLRREWNQKSKG